MAPTRYALVIGREHTFQLKKCYHYLSGGITIHEALEQRGTEQI
jgi:hypothetical protein